MLSFLDLLVLGQQAFQPQVDLLHCSAGATIPFLFLEYGDRTDAISMQGTYVMLGFVIGTHSTLDMPVVLRGTYENLSVNEKSCNRLSLSLGNKPVSGSSTTWGITTGSVVSPLLLLTMDASS